MTASRLRVLGMGHTCQAETKAPVDGSHRPSTQDFSASQLIVDFSRVFRPLIAWVKLL